MTPDGKSFWRGRGRAARAVWDRAQGWARDHLPPGLRLVVGLMFLAGGLLGFLPVLGFWMIPLGLAIAALDVLPIWRWWRGR